MTDELRVSAVRQHRRNRDRVLVEAGGDTFTVAPEFVVRLGIREGGELSPGDRKALAEESSIVAAMDRGLVLLSHRPRARAELARRLTRLRHAPGAVDAALARLARLGYLDDEAFARQLARSRILASGQSRYRIRTELLRKGVDRAVADAAIDETLAAEDVDESVVIGRVAAKKWRAMAKLDPPVRRRRLYAFLARRGFAAEDIGRAVEECERGAER